MKTSAALAFIVGTAVLLAPTLVFTPGTARADCGSTSEACSPSEIRYLQALQSQGFDVSDGAGANAVNVGKEVCADGNSVNITTESNKVWRAANGSMSQNQAFALVELALTMLCAH